MRKDKLKKIAIDVEQLRYKKPQRNDCNKVIKEFGLYELEDNNPILYVDLGSNNDKLIKAFQDITYYRTIRTGGLKSHSALLGYKPRNPLKEYFCSMAGMSYNHPLEHELFLDTSKFLAEIYKKHLPKEYQKHIEKLKEKDKDGKKLLQEYIIEGTPFTSGIVNKNNELKYHLDTGNIKDVCSAMIVLKQDVIGGYLSIPEYDVSFELANNSALFFNGQKIYHGVTPIYRTSINAYRYSAVFYTLESMWKCLTSKEELAEAHKYYEERNAKQN